MPAQKTQIGNLIKPIAGRMAFGATNTTGQPLNEEVIDFVRTVTLTAATSTTAVAVITDADVPAGFQAYVFDLYWKVNGATAWTNITDVRLQDTNGAPVRFYTIAVAALTGNALGTIGTANTTAESALALGYAGTGGTAGKGLQIVATGALGVGSDLVMTITGQYRRYIAP